MGSRPAGEPSRHLRIVAAAVMLAMAGCASAPHVASYHPAVDTFGEDPRQIEADIADCHSMARRTPAWHTIVNGQGNVAGQAIVGALLGAALGAALGDGLTGYQGSITRYGAAVGALHGVASGAGDVDAAVDAYKDVIHRCLSHRGYLVY